MVPGAVVGLAGGRYPAFLRTNVQIHLYRFLIVAFAVSPCVKSNAFSLSAPNRRFLIALAFLLGLLVGYNILIWQAAGKSQHRKLLRALDSIPANTDCLFLGNSLVEAGCDVRVFKSTQANVRVAAPMNLALGGTSPVEHVLILNRALQRPLKINYVIYGFFDDQLTSPVRGDWSDLIGNRALSYYFPDEAAALYAPGARTKKWEMRIFGRLPMLAERSFLWEHVEVLRRKIEEIGLPKRKTNRFGRVEDFSVSPAEISDFNRRCAEVVSVKQTFSRPIREIIRLARSHGARVIFVEMPMPSAHRNLFYSSPAWAAMRAHLETLAEKSEVVYLDASNWVLDDACFEDAEHLNKAGAKLFSEQLGIVIAAMSSGTNQPVVSY